MEKKKILITGFMPFGGETINPAWEAVKGLEDTIGACTLIKREIPVVFDEAAAKVEEFVRTYRPDAVICVGQAGGRAGITPEFVGINYQHAGIPDNAGNRPQERTIKQDGENAYFTTLPVHKMVKAVTEKKIKSSVSYSAGTYVCNDVLYQVLYQTHRDKSLSEIKVGFIHVPYLPEQVKEKEGVPSMELEIIVRGLTEVIRALDDTFAEETK